MERKTFSRLCDVGAHRRLRYVGEEDGIDIYFCEDCKGLRIKRAHWSAQLVKSIIQVAEAFRRVVPKTSSENIAHEYALKQDIIDWCGREYGMNPETTHRAIDWLIEVGKVYSLAVNGVPHLIERKPLGRESRDSRFEAFVRLRDVLGDPPILTPFFKCKCGTALDVLDLLDGQLFACHYCGLWWIYGTEVEDSILPPLPTPARVIHTIEQLLNAPLRTLISLVGRRRQMYP